MVVSPKWVPSYSCWEKAREMPVIICVKPPVLKIRFLVFILPDFCSRVKLRVDPKANFKAYLFPEWRH